MHGCWRLQRHGWHLIDWSSCDDVYGMVIHFDNWQVRGEFYSRICELHHNKVVHCTYDTAGDDKLRLWRAARPNVTKS